MIELYSLTPYGVSISGSTSSKNDNDPAWETIRFLAFRKRATPDDIKRDSKIQYAIAKSNTSYSSVMARLLRHDPPIVKKEGMQEV